MVLRSWLALAVTLVVITTTVPGQAAFARTLIPLTQSTASTTSTGAEGPALTRQVMAGDWPAVRGFNIGGNSNPGETTITSANVATLARDWARPAIPIPALIVAGGLVITSTAGPSGGAAMTALDPTTGRVVWRRADLPLIASVADKGSLYATGMTTVGRDQHIVFIALDLATGRTRWTAVRPEVNELSAWTEMAAAGGRLFAETGRGTVIAVSTDDGHQLWARRGLFTSGLTVSNGWLLTSSAPGGPGGPIALDVRNGSIRWQGSGMRRSPFAIPNLLVDYDDSRVAVWRRQTCATKCPLAWSRSFDGRVWSVTGDTDTVVAALGGVHISHEIQAFTASTGRPLWSASSPGAETVTTAGDLTFAYANDAPIELRAWRTAGCGAAICPPLWRYTLNSDDAIMTPLVVAHGRMYVILRQAGLQALALGTRTPSFRSDSSGRAGLAAVSSQAGQLDLVGVDSFGRLVHRAWKAGSSWDPWQVVGGSHLAGTPAITSWAPGRLDVFVRTESNALMHIWWHGRWSRLEQVGTNLFGDPTAVSWGGRYLSVQWVVGRSDSPRTSARQLRWDGRWEPVVAIPGSVFSNLAAVSTTTGSIDLFGHSNVEGLVTARYRHGTWSSWVAVHDEHGQYLGFGPYGGSSAVSISPTRIDLFFSGWGQGVTGVGHVRIDNGRFTSRQDIPAIFASAPAAVSHHRNLIDVFGVGTDLAVEQLTSVTGGWRTATP